MSPIVIKLTKPIAHGSVTITELTFRSLKAKDLRRLQSPAERSMAMILELAGYLCGQPTQVIDELEGVDLHAVIRVVNDFFAGTLGTGTEGSQSSQHPSTSSLPS